MQKKAEARDLYEQVFYSLDLIEKDYFGLQFTDVNHVKHWLDPTKAIKKQIKSKWVVELNGRDSRTTAAVKNDSSRAHVNY